MAADAAPSNAAEVVASRMPPDEAAAQIVDRLMSGAAAAIVGAPPIHKIARRACWEPEWAAAMMAAWQLRPLVERMEREGRDVGL